MFYWNSNIYMDEKVKKKPSRFRKIVQSHKIIRECYCITLPVNEENCMDIYNSREFWFRYYREKEIEIIGLAADRSGVEEILGAMVSDIIRAYGVCNHTTVKEFFKQKR